MEKFLIALTLLISFALSSSCLHDRDNPNDPGAVDNYVDGEPEFRLRQDVTEIAYNAVFYVTDMPVGGSSDTVFHIDNTGDAYLDLTGMQMTVSSAFTAKTSPSTPVKPGASTSFTIRFSPPDPPGGHSVIIYINYINEYGDESVFRFTMTGTGY